MTLQTQAEILKQIQRIEQDNNVKVLYACESGSRAWGFASNDSDYDVRFIYVHPQDWYLQIGSKRDVIEVLYDDRTDILDMSGWDIRKALQLGYKSNPALLEWVYSPIVYKQHKNFLPCLRKQLKGYSPKALMHHYVSMATSTYNRHWVEGYSSVPIRYKDYLYVIRALLCVQYMHRNKCRLPPVNFGNLLNVSKMDAAVWSEIGDLRHDKTSSTEKNGKGRFPALDAWIVATMAEARSMADAAPTGDMSEDGLNALLRRVVGS